MGRAERYGLRDGRFVTDDGRRRLAPMEEGSPSPQSSPPGRGGCKAEREAFPAHCCCLLRRVLDCAGHSSARSQRLVARKPFDLHQRHRAGIYLSQISVLQFFLRPHSYLPRFSHHRRALHLREDSGWFLVAELAALESESLRLRHSFQFWL